MTLAAADAAAYARVALTNVRRAYPVQVVYVVTEPADPPQPRDLHPAFYGSFDWHSCVEMHWVLVRLLRLFPELEDADEIRSTLDEHLEPERIAAELRFFESWPSFERPYGWGWLLTLAHECQDEWAEALAPLADWLASALVEWLPRVDYPVRSGMHADSAFALSRSLAYARARRPDLERAIVEAATRWFADDVDIPARFEPSGFDFLSPALTEAELMRSILVPDEFARWFKRFLPELPASLREPAVVSDPTDGYIAHLHGLNLSRAWCLRRIAEVVPNEELEQAAHRHAEASLSYVVGSDYAIEHWLAAYALLFFTESGGS